MIGDLSTFGTIFKHVYVYEIVYPTKPAKNPENWGFFSVFFLYNFKLEYTYEE